MDLNYSTNYYLIWNKHGATWNGEVEREINFMEKYNEFGFGHTAYWFDSYFTNFPKGDDMVIFRQTM